MIEAVLIVAYLAVIIAISVMLKHEVDEEPKR